MNLETDTWVAYMGLLALMVGVVRLAVGVFKLGFVVDLISNSVVIGFTAAGAMVIALSQFKHLFGFSITNTTHIFTIISDIVQKLELTNPYTLSIGVGAYLIIWVSKRISPYLPGALIAVVVTSLITYLLHLTDKGVTIVGHVPQGLPDPGMPPLDLQTMSKMWGGALVVAFFRAHRGSCHSKDTRNKGGRQVEP
ncbi:MAG: SulP family inorganic anion transporter [Aquificota bacterium]|nr:SulP family inorganic anion transporter [Aquificota bacterium]